MNNELNIAFVVLHYNAINETIACVESIIKNIDTDNFKVVLVDNGSPNKTGIRLKQYFKLNKYVDIILNKKNLGFAKGNNIGINYARNILKANYICCLNNDTLLEQSDFFNTIQETYLATGAALIGPQVIKANGKVQKFASKIVSKDMYKKLLLALTKESYIEYLKYKIKNFSFFIFLNSIRKKIIGVEEDPYVSHENVLLHGCCLIFTPVFFDYLKGFDDRTFLYREEELLYLAIRRNKLNTLYTPSLKIYHLEDCSTKTISKNKNEIEKFKQKYLIESTKILLETLEE